MIIFEGSTLSNLKLKHRLRLLHRLHPKRQHKVQHQLVHQRRSHKQMGHHHKQHPPQPSTHE